jgi:ferredoxin-fold anticodon binding domain-containing protein
MTLYKQLRKIIIYHLIAGIVFSLVLFTAISLKKYEESLLDVTSRNLSMKTKIIELERVRADMESEIKYMESEKEYMEILLLSDFSKSSPEKFILLAIDDMKIKMPWAEMSIADIKEIDDEIYLSLDIRIPVYDYTTLLNYIGYLATLKFPFYTIENFTIIKSQQPPEDVICNIKGMLRIPIMHKETVKQ